MKENSIEETIKQLKLMLKVRKEQKEIIECAGGSCMNCDPDIKALSKSIDILSDYKRVLKENEIYKKNSEIMSKENLSTAEQLKVEIKENFRLKNQLENNRKEYQETYKDVREELKELKKENEELNKYTIHLTDEQYKTVIDLAQNDINQQWIQKVKDKIEEYKKMLLSCNRFSDVDRIKAINERILELQELLEGRK